MYIELNDENELEVTETEEIQADDPGEDQIEGEESQVTETDGDETVVQIGDEEPPTSEAKQETAKWVKDLRQRQKELVKRNAELEARLNAGNPAANQAPTLPAFPRIADYDYDEEKLESAVKAWNVKNAEVEAFKAKEQEQIKQRQESVQKINEGYTNSVKALKVKDYEDAEDMVTEHLSEVQQAILKAGLDNPAAIVYALGKNPAKLSELASINDPVRYAVAIGKLETKVTVTKRNSTKPAPESTVRASGGAAATSATLDRLRSEAEKTGDYSKVADYQRQQRAASKT